MPCVHFTEYDTRVAAYAVIVDEHDQVLLTWYNGEGHNPPGWSLPGGGVEYDETLEQAVVREVHEEAGYHVEVGAPLTTQAWGHTNGTTRSEKPYKAVKVIFDATVIGGALGTIEVGGSTDFAEWVPLADLEGRGRPRRRGRRRDRGVARAAPALTAPIDFTPATPAAR